MKYVITGATGFIASALIEKLSSDSDNIIYAIIRPNSANRRNLSPAPNINVIELSYDRYRSLNHFINDKVDVFIHFAWDGIRGGDRNDTELQMTNYRATIDAYHTANDLKCEKYIGCGSQAEYGIISGNIIENSQCFPDTEYGKMKLKSFIDISEFAHKDGMTFIWPRIFSVYGENDYSASLIMSLIRSMRDNAPISLTKCEQNWDYIHVKDVALIYKAFAEKDCVSGAYNIAAGEVKPLRAYVEIIKSIMKSESVLNYGDVPYHNGGEIGFIPDVNKMVKETGWKQTIDFQTGIREILCAKYGEEYCEKN